MNYVYKIVGLFLIVVFAAGCSGELSRGEAEDIIWESHRKDKYETVKVGQYNAFGQKRKFDVNNIPYEISIKASRRVQKKLSSYTIDVLPKYLRDYINSGFLLVKLPENIENDKDGRIYAIYTVRISDKAKPYLVKLDRSKQLMYIGDINAKFINMKLDEVDVTGIVGDERQAIVQATIIYNKTDISISEKEHTEYKKKFQFLKYDDGWRIGTVISSFPIDW